jgi:hypothetical protein
MAIFCARPGAKNGHYPDSRKPPFRQIGRRGRSTFPNRFSRRFPVPPTASSQPLPGPGAAGCTTAGPATRRHWSPSTTPVRPGTGEQEGEHHRQPHHDLALHRIHAAGRHESLGDDHEDAVEDRQDEVADRDGSRSGTHKNEVWRSSTDSSSTQYSEMKIGIWTRMGRQPPSGLTFSFL